jgi:hypothetical protein
MVAMSALAVRRHRALFDYLVGGHDQAHRYSQSKSPRCFAIDDGFIFVGCLYWKIARLGAAKDLIDVSRCLPILLDGDNPIGHQAPGGDEELVAVDRW